MTWWWGLLAAAALLWPDHVVSWFDGAPLDRPAEVIVVGVLFPLLLTLDPSFLRTRVARSATVALLVWRVFTSVALTQEGLCVRMQPTRPYVVQQRGAPHSWDVRADWRSPDPACSAIMTRPYDQPSEFPAWFYNLPPIGDAPLAPEDRPPVAVTVMTVSGFVHAQRPGLLHVQREDDTPVLIRVDGGPEGDAPQIPPGTHAVMMTTTLTGDRWRFVPLLDNRPLSSTLLSTVRRGSPLDLLTRRWARWVPVSLVVILAAGWIVSVLKALDDLLLVAWSAAASITLALLFVRDHADAARWGIAGLAAAAALPIARRNRSTPGLTIAIGIPWLVYVVVRAIPAVGRFTLYEWGNDFWTFQRYAYRIALQGFWLEGGSATFWFQPLYRWVAAVLHLIFGDSSVGETLWDGACLLVGAIWTFVAVRMRARFALGLGAAVLSLTLFIVGTPRDLIGRGLGEITSAGFLYLAAVLAIKGRRSNAAALVGSGICAVLGFYTRLNNLPMAVAVMAFAVPADVRVRDVVRMRTWIGRMSATTIVTIVVALAVGALLLAGRTWYYTGIFSMFYGTQRQYLALWPAGVPLRAAMAAMLDSVLMVLTMNDPPRWDVHALPVLCGAAACVAAVLGMAKFRDMPLSIVVFAFGSIAGALVARGSAYPGRFSIHVLPAMSAACGLAIASFVPALCEADAAAPPPLVSMHSSSVVGVG
jgi:hypothetical protein